MNDIYLSAVSGNQIMRTLWGKMFGAEEWNNKWYVYVGPPIFAFLGAVLVWSFGRQLVSSELGLFVVGLLFSWTTVVTGCAILAVIDGS